MQVEFFNILDEFFRRATGDSAEDFASLDEFPDAIRKNAEKLGRHGESAWRWGVDALLDYYRRHQFDNFKQAKSYGGMKLVLGGGSRFLPTQLGAVRKMLLYTDTILIPDPVYPWLEVERSEEKFNHVNMLQNVFTLLHLKPLIDAELPYPAIFVFQSWEKRLEKDDEKTLTGIENLIAGFFSHYTGNQFGDVGEVLDCLLPGENSTLVEHCALASKVKASDERTSAMSSFPINISVHYKQTYNARHHSPPCTIIGGIVILRCYSDGRCQHGEKIRVAQPSDNWHISSR
jgi:hypothetical protein